MAFLVAFGIEREVIASLMPVAAAYILPYALCATIMCFLLGSHRPDFNELAKSTDEILSFSKWSVLGSLAFSGYNFAIQSVLGLISGPASLGALNAARNVIQPTSSLIQAIDSVDKPRASRAYAHDGVVGLLSVTRGSVGTLLFLGVPYLLFIGFFPKEVLNFLYGAASGYSEGTLVALCAMAVLMLCAQPIETSLYVLRRPRSLFFNRLVASLVSLPLAFLLIEKYGALGAALSLTIGWAVSLLGGCKTVWASFKERGHTRDSV